MPLDLYGLSNWVHGREWTKHCRNWDYVAGDGWSNLMLECDDLGGTFFTTSFTSDGVFERCVYQDLCQMWRQEMDSTILDGIRIRRVSVRLSRQIGENSNNTSSNCGLVRHD